MLSKSQLSKFFLISYFIIFFVIFFIQDSVISTNLSHLKMISTLFAILGIILNLFLVIIGCLKENIFNNIILAIFIIIIFIIPILCHVVILSPILCMIIMMLLNIHLVNPYKFIKTDLFMRISVLFTIIICYFLHLFPVIHDYAFRGSMIRYGLGFNHPNTLAIMVLSIFISYFLSELYKYNNHKLLVLFTFIMIYIFISIVSDSREFQILGFVLLLVYGLYNIKFCQYFLNILSKILVLPIILCSSFISIIFSLDPDYTLPFFYWLNKISSNRLIIQSKALIEYPIHWFGYLSVPLLNFYKISIDNYYMSVLIHYGIIGVIIIIFIFVKASVYSIRIKNFFARFSLIIVSIAFITIFSDDLYSIFIFIYALFFYNHKEIKKGEKYEASSIRNTK